jgi:hypothetical protein
MNSEDVDSGTVRDRSAYDNHGTLNGNYGIGLQAPNGNSVFLNGEGGTYITVPSSSKYNSKTFSISVWVNVESIHSGDSRIIYHSGSDSAITTGFGIEYRGCGGSFGGGPSSTADKWDHLTYIWDDGNDEYRTYLNGQLTNQSGMGGACFANSNGGFNLGTPHWTSDGSYLRGKISDVRAYDRVLSEPEIQQLANQRTSPVMSVGGIDTSNVTASGGNEYTKTVLDVDYKIHEFTSDGTFSVSEGGNVDVLIVAGGGGGGGSGGGGGGAGGLIFENNVSITSGSYSVTVGSGGSGGEEETTAAGDGGNSSFLSYTAIGGGGGGTRNIDAGHDGGSGGGGNKQGFNDPGLGTDGQGFDGGFGNNYSANGVAGGGGGAKEKGEDETRGNGGNGGDGLYFGGTFSDSFGENGYFAGGGGGSAERFVGAGGDGADDGEVISVGNGGKGGGGRAGGRQGDSSGNGVDAIDGTGGGGGGANQRGGSNGTRIGGDGGNGIVLIRYKN